MPVARYTGIHGPRCYCSPGERTCSHVAPAPTPTPAPTR